MMRGLACAALLMLAACDAGETEADEAAVPGGMLGELPSAIPDVPEPASGEAERGTGAALASSGEPRPVMIGTDGADLDACHSQGQAFELEERGETALAVRARPQNTAQIVDRLGPDRLFNVCGSADGWYGIVYPSAAAPDAECGVGSPVASPRPYDGPCRSGWVRAEHMLIVAG